MLPLAIIESSKGASRNEVTKKDPDLKWRFWNVELYGLVLETGRIFPLKYAPECKAKSPMNCAICSEEVGAVYPGKAASSISV